MRHKSETLIDLETSFWKSMVDQNSENAVALLCEPALMVSAHGAMQFNHAQYRQMADHGSMIIEAFEFSEMRVMFPSETTAILSYRVKQRVATREQKTKTQQEMHDTSTWILTPQGWRCAIHTETPVAR